MSAATAAKTWKKAELRHRRRSSTTCRWRTTESAGPWASSALILRTEDGGNTWKAQANRRRPRACTCSRCVALDANRAWAVGDWGTRLHTTDGGKTLAGPLAHDRPDPPAVRVALASRSGARAQAARRCSRTSASPTSPACPATRTAAGSSASSATSSTRRTAGWTGRHAELAEGRDLGGLKLDRSQLGYNVIELPEADTRARRRVRQEDRRRAAPERRDRAARDRSGDRRVRPADDPTPLFEIIEARTQEIQAVLEEAGILSDRIRASRRSALGLRGLHRRRSGVPDALLRERKARATPASTVSISQNPYLFTVRFADPNGPDIAASAASC